MNYLRPRFFFSMNTCSSTGAAQMGQTYRRVVSLKSGSRVCLQLGQRMVSGFSSLGLANVVHRSMAEMSFHTIQCSFSTSAPRAR